MRRWMLRPIALLMALPIVAFVALWLLLPNKQKQYENVLMGKTLAQAEGVLGSKPSRYLTREQLRQREMQCGWPAEVDAVAHWYKGPKGSQHIIIVVFNGAGTAIEVVYESAFSQWFRRSFGDP